MQKELPNQFFSDFEKNKQKIQKNPFYTQNWNNPKNTILMAERVVKSISTFSLTPSNVHVLILKQFSNFTPNMSF